MKEKRYTECLIKKWGIHQWVLLPFLLLSYLVTLGGTGIYQTYAIIDRGSGNEYYAGGINSFGATPFNGLNLGSFNADGTLKLNGGEVLTWKNEGGNVTGSFIYYRIYSTTGSPGSFIQIDLPFFCEHFNNPVSCPGTNNPGDQKWTRFAHNVNVLTGLAPGDYYLEVYWLANSNEGDRFDTNFGNNYKATFTVLPPPPVDCILTPWGPWSDWSTDACGVSATRTRTRSVITPAANGGAECGPLFETETRTNAPCPVDCVVSEWGPWSAWSSDACGETATRTSTRTIITPAANGGAECETLEQTETRENAPCPVDCVVSEWGPWSAWSAECGPATRTRTRTIITPAANGGSVCGPLFEEDTRNIPISENEIVESACGSYEWNGRVYTESGRYTGTTANCVTDVLVLTITPIAINTTTITACDSYTWAVNNQTYTESGTYTVEVVDNPPFGCPRIEKLVLTIGVSGGEVVLDAPAPVAVDGISPQSITITAPVGTTVVSWQVSGTSNTTNNGTVTVTSAVSGVFPVWLTYTNSCGQQVNTAPVYAVFYNPEGGFVTGGGWIHSPAGAYKSDESLTGRANFGFVAKYKKGSTVPEGDSEFRLNAAGLVFKSTSYEDGRLVISNHKANFRGTGIIEGLPGTFGFLISAIDGQISGGGGVDKFRIRIWDQLSGVVVYDNNLEQTGEEADPVTAIGGGSIVIHAPKVSRRGAAELITGVSDKLQLRVANNPAVGGSDFRVQVLSDDAQSPINLRMLNMSGQPVEQQRNLQSGAAIEFGAGYSKGMYMVEAIQGGRRSMLKVIKL